MGTGSRRRSMLVCERLERRDAPAVIPQGPEFRVNVNTAVTVASPAVAVAGNGNSCVVWEANGVDGQDFAILARRYDNNGSPLGSEFQVNIYTTGSQQNPAIAMDAAGNFVIVWGSASVQDGSREGIFMRRYDANGSALTGEIQVNQFTLNVQGQPTVAMDTDGDFVIGWESNYQDGDGYAIYARMYNAQGNPATSEFRVNQSTIGDQQKAAVAIDSTGDFVIVWQGEDANGYGVYGRRYNSAGVAQGGEFLLNTQTMDDQTSPAVGMAASGDFTAVWESRVEDGGTAGIYARRYNASGLPLSDAFRVNSFSPGNQTQPTIVSNAAGDLTITWTSSGQDGDNGGIYGQRINAAGALDGSEFQIHSTTAGNQSTPALGSNGIGDCIVTWSGSASPLTGIIAQRFGPPPAPRAVISIDDGSGQRSSIRFLKLEFNTITTIANGGLVLTGPVGDVGLVYDYTASTPTKTIVKVTFTGPSATNTGLISGHYILTLNSSLITNVDGVGYDGDGDGLPGPGATINFHRWYGDVDGDGDTDAFDFIVFRQHFGSDSSQVGFKYWLDFDGDGSISAFDLGKFRQYFCTNI